MQKRYIFYLLIAMTFILNFFQIQKIYTYIDDINDMNDKQIAFDVILDF